ASTLLSDWVFTQNPRSVQQVIELIIDGIGLRFLVARAALPRRRLNQGVLPELPPKCGRDELVARCFEILGEFPPKDYETQILSLIRVNSTSQSDLLPQWLAHMRQQTGAGWLTWMEYGLQLGALSIID